MTEKQEQEETKQSSTTVVITITWKELAKEIFDAVAQNVHNAMMSLK